MSSRIYLACPYTHPSPAVRAERYQQATKAAAEFMKNGILVYSPLTHGHELALCGDLPGDFAFWEAHCLSFLQHWAEALCVLCARGWQDSRGVTAEIAEAYRLGLPVHLLEAPHD